MVSAGLVGWSVRDSVKATGYYIYSVSGSTCPANPRAARSQRGGRNNWSIGDSDVVKGEIRVVCDTHKKWAT